MTEATILDFNDAAGQAPREGSKPIAVALAYAARGWPVFPCNPLNKRPLVEHGFHAATTDPFKIRAWWGQWPHAMVGIPTGTTTGFWAFDIDMDEAKGKNGALTLASLGHDKSELLDTVVSRTASGGLHCLFRFDESAPILCWQNRPGRHLDTRGEGGYIIAPGSRLSDGRLYEWLNPPDENEIEKAPTWLLDAIMAASGAAQLGVGTADAFDFNTAAPAPKTPQQRVAAIEPGTWHENTRDLVARMVKEGSSDETIAAIAPGFTLAGYTDAQTVREFLVHARTARAKWGHKPRDLATEGLAGAEHIQPAVTAEPVGDKQRFRILSIDELMDVKAPEWRIEGIFPTHGSSVLYGAYETFKTFIAIDWTLCLATGSPWHGRAAKPCRVLYIAGEGQTGLGMRVKGWLAAHQIAAADARFSALPEAVALPHPGDQDALLRQIEAMSEPPEVIVLDTVTRMTGGGSLNDEKDAQAYVRGMDRLRIATGAHMLNIGHSGKDKERGILGSVVLPAAMETIVCVERTADSLRLINSNPKGKQKDGPSFEDVRLVTQIREFEHQGKTEKTIILMPDDDVVSGSSGSKAEPAQRLGPIENKILAALGQAATAGQGLRFMRLSMMTGGPQDSSLNKALKRLVEKGLILKAGEEYLLP